MSIPLRLSLEDEAKLKTALNTFRTTISTSRDLTPGQQLALLTIRKSYLSDRVIEKLRRSTVRAIQSDYDTLIDNRLIRRKGISYEILPLGLFKANNLARELARQLGIAYTSGGTPMTPRGSFQRKYYTRDFTQ